MSASPGANSSTRSRLDENLPFTNEEAVEFRALRRQDDVPLATYLMNHMRRITPRLGTVLASLIATIWWSECSWADTLFLQGGEKLLGKVISEDSAKVVFESQTLGKLEIASQNVERILRDVPQATAVEQSVKLASSAAPSTSRYFPWTDTTLKPGGLDWIQLKSGEWLGGRIKSLQDEKFDFDSEELNVLTFDWKDIRTVYASELVSVRIENGKPMNGSLLVTSNKVQIITPTATNTFPRAELVAIAPTGSHEFDKWTGKISAGMSFRSGNTHEVDVEMHAALERRTPNTRLSLDYLGNYGRINGEEIENNHRFTGQFDYFLSRRLYVRVPDVEYLHDPFQNLDHRVTLGAGLGYDLVKTSRTEWNVTVSPSWQKNWFFNVPPGENSIADAGALVLSTRFDIELTRWLEFIFEYRGQFTRKETGNNTHHTLATLEFELHKRLKLDLSFVWDRISSPQAESSGIAPTPDDFRLITSLGVSF